MSDEQKKEPKTPLPQTATPKREESQEQEDLAETELEKVAGGIVSPRDAASGMATGKRNH